MGAIIPTLTTALLAQGASEVSRSKSRGNQGAALQQLQAKQNLQMSQAQGNAALDREKITLDSANAEDARKKALRRAVARRRASFGAQGVGSGSGSSQAVLLGMFEESTDEKSKREGLDALRFNAIDSDLSQRKSLNVLQRTQLQERQKIGRVSAGDSFISNLF